MSSVVCTKESYKYYSLFHSSAKFSGRCPLLTFAFPTFPRNSTTNYRFVNLWKQVFFKSQISNIANNNIYILYSNSLFHSSTKLPSVPPLLLTFVFSTLLRILQLKFPFRPSLKSAHFVSLFIHRTRLLPTPMLP